MLSATLMSMIAHASHLESWSVVRERAIDPESHWAWSYRGMEACSGLSAPLPRLARVVPAPCPSNPRLSCLPNGWGGAYNMEHGVILLPLGNRLWFDHEALHHLKLHAQGDVDEDHSDDEWRECHR